MLSPGIIRSAPLVSILKLYLKAAIAAFERPSSRIFFS